MSGNTFLLWSYEKLHTQVHFKYLVAKSEGRFTGNRYRPFLRGLQSEFTWIHQVCLCEVPGGVTVVALGVP